MAQIVKNPPAMLKLCIIVNASQVLYRAER